MYAESSDNFNNHLYKLSFSISAMDKAQYSFLFQKNESNLFQSNLKSELQILKKVITLKIFKVSF